MFKKLTLFLALLISQSAHAITYETLTEARAAAMAWCPDICEYEIQTLTSTTSIYNAFVLTNGIRTYEQGFWFKASALCQIGQTVTQNTDLTNGIESVPPICINGCYYDVDFQGTMGELFQMPDGTLTRTLTYASNGQQCTPDPNPGTDVPPTAPDVACDPTTGTCTVTDGNGQQTENCIRTATRMICNPPPTYNPSPCECLPACEPGYSCAGSNTCVKGTVTLLCGYNDAGDELQTPTSGGYDTGLCKCEPACSYGQTCIAKNQCIQGIGSQYYCSAASGYTAAADGPTTQTTSDGNGNVTVNVDMSGVISKLGGIQTTLTGIEGSLTKGYKGGLQPLTIPGGDTVQSDKQQAETEFQTLLTTIRAEASSYVTINTGTGQLPCWTFPYKSETIRICPADYEQELSLLAYVVLLMGALASAYIMLR